MSSRQSEAGAEVASASSVSQPPQLDPNINEWFRQYFGDSILNYGVVRSGDESVSENLAANDIDIPHCNAMELPQSSSSNFEHGWTTHQGIPQYQSMIRQPIPIAAAPSTIDFHPFQSPQASFMTDTSFSGSSYDLASYISYGITSQRSVSFAQMTTAQSQNTQSGTPSSMEHMSEQSHEPNPNFNYPENFDTSRTGSNVLPFLGLPPEDLFMPSAEGNDGTHMLRDQNTSQRDTILHELFMGESVLLPSDHFESSSLSNLQNLRQPSIPIKPETPDKDQPPSKMARGNESQRKPTVKTPEKQAKVNKMRKVKACLRCRSFHKECDEGKPCNRCKALISGARTYFEPCFRENLGDAVVSRHGNTEFGQFNIQFESYLWDTSSTPQDVKIIWRLPGDDDVEIALPSFECRKFISAPNSKPHRLEFNNNGVIVKVELPRYAATANQKLNLIIAKFLEDSRSVILDGIVASLPDELSIITFQEAIRYEQSSQVIKLALDIRCAAYCSEGSGVINGDQPFSNEYTIQNESVKTGYTKIDKSHGLAVPLSLDHQIDVAMLQRVQKLQKQLLKLLSKMILAKDTKKVRKSWYEVFLATYIILSNLEWVHGSAWSYFQALKETSQERFARTMLGRFIEEFDISARNILFHFRHILRGDYPFQAVEKDPDKFRAETGVDDEAIRYIQRAMRMQGDTGEEHIDAAAKRVVETAELPETIKVSTTGELPPPNGRWLSLLFARLHL